MAFDYDAEYLEINKTYKLNKDGSISETHHKKVKLHTYRATQRLFGEDFITYNPEFQTLKINKSITTMVDGKIVETPQNGYNEVLPRGADGDESYANYREMVVTHTGLEKGCVVDFSYTIETKAGYYSGLMGEIIFAENDPVLSYQVKVIVPKSIELKYDTKNGTILVNKEEDKNHYVYTWNQKNINAILTEPNRVALGNHQLKLVFSTVKNWDELYKYFDESVNQKDKISVEMQKKVNELTDELSNPFDKIQKIHKFVVNATGYARLSPIYSGYKSKAVQTTYNENSGNILDKAVLLSSMLNYAGLGSHVCFVSNSDSFADSVASLNQFDDIVVVTRWTNGETHIISPIKTDNNSLDANLSGKYLFRLNKKIKKIIQLKYSSMKNNCQKMSLNLKLSDELKFSGSGSINNSGKYNQYYTLKNNNNIGKVINSSLVDLKSENKNITKLNINESVIQFDISSDELESENGFIYLDLPEFSYGFNNNHISTAMTSRTTPLDLHNAQSEFYTFRITLPENVELVTPQHSVLKKCEIGMAKIGFSQDGKVIVINKSLIIKDDKVCSDKYVDFRKMIKVWQSKKYSQIVLKVK